MTVAIQPETLAGRARWMQAQDEARLTKLREALDLYKMGRCAFELVVRVVRRIESRAFQRGFRAGIRHEQKWRGVR